MPWITVDVPDAGPGLATTVADAAGTALGLTRDDVIVIVRGATETAGAGAVVTIVGGDRGAAAEERLHGAVSRAVATALGVDADRVAVVRHVPRPKGGCP